LKSEIARLNKMIQVLMDRAERSTHAQGSDFSLFQTTVMLEEQVHHRTSALEAALREIEAVNRALQESEAMFRGLVSQSLVGIVIIKNGKFTYSNTKFDEIFGYSADEVRDLGPLDVVIENDRPLVAENMRKRLSGEVDRVEYVFRGLRKNGAVVDIEVHSNVMEIAGTRVMIGMIIDVTERARAAREVQVLQERLREQSTHDSLTGLYNRRYLDEIIGQELISAGNRNYPVSVIMSDLDHFKAVNDRYGHAAGDEALRIMGRLMTMHARAGDICCRYGGEEFLLVLPGVAKDIALERAERLRSAISATSIPHDASQIQMTASFGIATFPGDGQNGDELISAADRALYAAKAAGRNRIDASSGQARGGAAAPGKGGRTASGDCEIRSRSARLARGGQSSQTSA
jgi:diguanylate cyclase (GGDEF)-like protein/PAS domain S-box-containing protein